MDKKRYINRRERHRGRLKRIEWWNLPYVVRVGVIGGWLFWLYLSYNYIKWLFI